ncbi:MAG: hypothetical protein KF901_13405 [Myxococcales bacterium]|nr:hypothetical protein [Myxococcales bacterium]
MYLRSLALVPLFVACGGRSTPSEDEIYYAAALRPGVEVATTEGERALLAQIGQIPEGHFEAAGERFELGPAYHSASGRFCRRVLTPRRERLACVGEGDVWTFVPNPFEGSTGADVPVLPAGYDRPEGAVDAAPSARTAQEAQP